MFADYDGPLWENDHPNYAMEPSDYDLPEGLARELVEWNRQFGVLMSARAKRRAWREWRRAGRALADRVAEVVRDYADVSYEP